MRSKTTVMMLGLVALIGLVGMQVQSFAMGSRTGIVQKADVPDTLRCEFLEKPMGITKSNPALSWQIKDPQRGASQTAYQVQVVSSEAGLKENNPDLWDSGKVNSDQSHLVEYGGKKLPSRQRVWWRVKYWNQNGVESDWSEPSWWEMGILDPAEFKGEWIRAVSQPLPEGEVEQQWVKDAIIPNAGYLHPEEERERINKDVVEAAAKRLKHAIPAYQIRREFVLEEPVRRARLYISTLGYHQITINGREVDDHRLEPSWSHYEWRADYVVKDVTDWLEEGANSIGIILSNGRYRELPGYNDRYYGEMPVVKAMLVAETVSGKALQVTTDEHWKSDISHITRDSFWVGEVQDARRLQPGWDKVGFDDSTWKGVEVVAPGTPGYPLPQTLDAQLYPPEKATERVAPVALSNPAPGVWVFDMGRTLVGNAELKINAPAGTVVSVRYAHLLWEEYPKWYLRFVHMASYSDQSIAQRPGMIAPKTRGDTLKHRGGAVNVAGGLPAIMNADVFVTRGDGEEVFERRFGYRPFRYVEVRGFPGKPPLDAITGVVLHTALETSNRSFTTSNPLFNQIEEAVKRSVLYNLHGHIQDNPGAEKGFFPHMAIWNHPTLALGGESSALIRKMLTELRGYTDDIGLVSVLTSKRRVRGVPDEKLPGFMSISELQSYVSLPWEYYLYYGDRKELELNYEVMKRYIEHLYRDLSTKGYQLEDQYGDVWQNATHFAVETTFRLDEERGYVPVTRKTIGTPREFYATAFGYHMLSRAETIARLLGHESDADRFAALRDGAHQFIKEKWYDPDSVTYAKDVSTSIQGINTMALAWGLADETEAPELVKQIQEDIRESGSMTTGMRLSLPLLNGLSRYGAVDDAFEIMNRTTYPSLGYLVPLYGTTPEGFGTPGFPHYVGSPVQTEVSQMGSWFYTWLCGLRPDFDQPGFKHFFVTPKIPTKLDSAEMEYESPYGRIAVRWRKTGTRFELHVTVPPNTTATVEIPVIGGMKAPEIREGTTLLSEVEGVSVVKLSETEVTCQVQSGSYSFSYDLGGAE
jgi:alpha-L-rhamnosidase